VPTPYVKPKTINGIKARVAEHPIYNQVKGQWQKALEAVPDNSVFEGPYPVRRDPNRWTIFMNQSNPGDRSGEVTSPEPIKSRQLLGELKPPENGKAPQSKAKKFLQFGLPGLGGALVGLVFESSISSLLAAFVPSALAGAVPFLVIIGGAVAGGYLGGRLIEAGLKYLESRKEVAEIEQVFAKSGLREDVSFLEVPEEEPIEPPEHTGDFEVGADLASMFPGTFKGSSVLSLEEQISYGKKVDLASAFGDIGVLNFDLKLENGEEVFLDKDQRAVEVLQSLDTTDQPALAAAFQGRVFPLGKLVGKGGMAQIYLAKDSEKNEVVVKIMHETPGAAEEVVANERAEIEFAVTKDLYKKSKHIVRVVGKGSTPKGIKFLVYESLAEFPTLHAVLKGKGKKQAIPGPTEALKWTGQILQGMIVAHKNGVFHRDLKPQNIFVAREGNEALLKIIDFGTAKVTNQGVVEGASRAELTKWGQGLGTLNYMAPEMMLTVLFNKGKGVAEGFPILSRKDREMFLRKGDIYAIGCIFYRMLTRKIPFEIDGPTDSKFFILPELCRDYLGKQLEEKKPALETIYGIIDKANPDPELERRDIPKPIFEVIKKAMAHDPRKRYNTCEDFLVELNSALKIFTDSFREQTQELGTRDMQFVGPDFFPGLSTAEVLAKLEDILEDVGDSRGKHSKNK